VSRLQLAGRRKVEWPPEKAPLRVVLCFYPDQPQDDIALGLAQRAWPSAFLRFPTVHRLEPEGRLRVVLPGRHAVGEWPLFADTVDKVGD
jgi:hypothetical protein